MLRVLLFIHTNRTCWRKYSSCLQARKRAKDALASVSARLEHTVSSPELRERLFDITQLELAGGRSVSHVLFVSHALMENQQFDNRKDLDRLWGDALSASSVGQREGQVRMRVLAESWCGDKIIDDPSGMLRFDQPSASKLFELLTDVLRYGACVSSGGEVPGKDGSESARTRLWIAHASLSGQDRLPQSWPKRWAYL